MVGYDPAQFKLSPWQHAAAGASSGCLTRLCCQPLDVLKIRFQLQYGRSGSTTSRYRGVVQAAARIVREEGVRALWKGHVPAQMLSVIYGTVQFSCFEFLTERLHHSSHLPSGGSSVNLHFIGGAASGFLATTASHPIDVVRTRLVAQGEPKFYASTRAAAAHMLRHEGAATFFRGFVPAVLLTAPYTSLQFGAYAFCSRLLGSLPVLDERPSVKALTAGLMAGLASKTAVYPMDVVKKRMQVQGFQNAMSAFGETRCHANWRRCLLSAVREEGVRGLYRGLVPSTIKAMLTTGLHFCFYDMSIRLMRSGASN